MAFGIEDRRFEECPKCGARGGCPKHGLTASGIDLRHRAMALSMKEGLARMTVEEMATVEGE